MEEWKEYRLGDICSRVCSGGTPSSRHDEYYGGNIPWLNTKEVDFKPIYNTEKKITQEGLENSSAKWIEENTIVVAMYGATAGKTAIAKIPLTTNQACCNLTINPTVADYRFVYYSLANKFNELASLANGGAQQNLNAQIIKDFVISLPGIYTQKFIANILSSLDEKIENNRKINSNLEEQAKALFKSWFIDFEPFKDGKFVDSELGKIPEGWEVGRYDDIVSATVAGDWGKDKPIGNYVHEVTCIRGCDFQDIKNGLTGNAPSRFILEKNFKNKCFANNDILVEISGGTQTVSTGRVCPISQELISRYNGNVVCTNFCRVLRPIEEYSAFIYYSWLYKYNHKVMFGYENGTSGIKNFRLNDFLSMEPLIIPPKDEVAEFQKVIDTINAQMQTTGLESSKLVETRDSLLPRLMSGEIEV